MTAIKKCAGILLFCLPVFFYGTNLHAQQQSLHAPVSAGSSTHPVDSERYKAMQERDRENIRKAIQQGKDNQEAIKASKNETLRNRKLLTKLVTSILFAGIGLLVYFRNKRKANAREEDSATG